MVNDSYRLAPWADVLYACDGRWWDHHGGAADFAGEKWTQNAGAANRWGLSFIASRAEPGLCLDGTAIHQGMNSGYQSINLAVLFGARRVILTGFDMGASATGKRHWFGDHPPGLTQTPIDQYAVWCKEFETMLPDMKRSGIDIINCSVETALSCFPRARLENVL